ncbi:phosphopantetheine-binding protein [Streptomyces sp. NPDC003753]
MSWSCRCTRWRRPRTRRCRRHSPESSRSSVAEEDYHAPNTSAERRPAAAWVKVLGLPADQVSRRDHFFDLCGTSLSALRPAIALDRAVSLEDLTHHPVLADLAVLVDDMLETAPGVPCVTESVAPS